MIRIMKIGQVSPREIFSRCEAAANVSGAVAEIIAAVRQDGDEALRRYARQFDRADVS